MPGSRVTNVNDNIKGEKYNSINNKADSCVLIHLYNGVKYIENMNRPDISLDK